MKKLYIALAVAGTILPYAFFVPFLWTHGLDIPLLIEQLFANNMSSFFATDFLICCVVFWVFVYQETVRYRIKLWWVCIIANLLVGLSLALPLFLYFRTVACEQHSGGSGKGA